MNNVYQRINTTRISTVSAISEVRTFVPVSALHSQSVIHSRVHVCYSPNINDAINMPKLQEDEDHAVDCCNHSTLTTTLSHISRAHYNSASRFSVHVNSFVWNWPAGKVTCRHQAIHAELVYVDLLQILQDEPISASLTWVRNLKPWMKWHHDSDQRCKPIRMFPCQFDIVRSGVSDWL